MRSGISGTRISLTRWRTWRGLDEARRLTAQDRLGAGHDQRGRHALVGHVADDDADAPVGQLDEVVEVAADRSCGAVVGGHLPAVQLGQLARQELLLDEGGDAHLLLEPLARLDLDRLLAHELGDTDGRRRLRGEGGQQLAIVGRVVLVGEARAEVEGADELALRHQRDDDPDAGRAKLGQGRRLEADALDVHDAWRALEIGEERVGGIDLDGRAGGDGGRLGPRDGAAIASGIGSVRPRPDRPADRLDECHGRVLRLHRPETVTGSQKLLDPSRILFADR